MIKYNAIFYILAAVLISALPGCTDLSGIDSKLKSVESSLYSLENRVAEVNGSIAAISDFCKGRTISNVAQSGNVYTITMSNGKTYVLHQGSPTATGLPVIYVDEEGWWRIFYPGKVSEDYILRNGQRIPAGTGSSVIPLVRVSADGFWQISSDGGSVYEFILDNEGNKIPATNLVEDAFFSSVTSDGDNIIFTLLSGKKYTVPLVSGLTCSTSASGIQKFAYGESRVFSMTMTKVVSATVFYPHGWYASLDGSSLSVKAPVAAGINMESSGTITVFASSSTGLSTNCEIYVTVE